MVNEQLDMAAFHELLSDDSADDQLVIVLKKLQTIKEPKTVKKALKESRLGSWSGWSM